VSRLDAKHQCKNVKIETRMTKKETIKWIVQIIASVATAIVTALSATSCVGM